MKKLIVLVLTALLFHLKNAYVNDLFINDYSFDVSYLPELIGILLLIISGILFGIKKK